MLSIKDFSKKTDYSIRMLRYLEEVGVLTPKRDSNNYRIYSDEQVDLAQKIKRLQNLGVQLKEVEGIQAGDKVKQIEILKRTLLREQEIAEIKSDSIPELKNIIDYISKYDGDIDSYFQNKKTFSKKLRTLGGEEKFHRTAYSIPILRNIYEDHLTIDSNIELIQTDLMKFSEWYLDCDDSVQVFSVLRESSFVFGKNITQKFIDGYELAWKKFLPEMGFMTLEGFQKNDVSQLMAPHDIIIRTTFKYKDSGKEGEIVIPYTPIYTMSQLSNKN